MTIYDIKHRTQKKQPYFFSRDTLRFFGQTMNDFKIKKQSDGKYLISAPARHDGRITHYTKRFFNPETNDLEFLPNE
jgi:hypothetical protein